MEKHIKMLFKTPLFYNLNEESFYKIIDCLTGKIKYYYKQELIYDFFTEINYAGIILEGEVEATTLNAIGNEHSIHIYTLGQMFAQSYACLQNQKSLIQIRARTNCKILFLKLSNLFNEKMSTYHFTSQVTINLLYIIAKSNIIQDQKLQILTQKNIRDKIITFLNSCYRKNNIINLHLNRQDLANYLNVERSALSREFSKMKNDGIIDYKKNKIIILNETFFPL